MTVVGTLWMLHFHSEPYDEVLIGKAEESCWSKVERQTPLYLECWRYLGRKVEAVIEDGLLKSLVGVEP